MPSSEASLAQDRLIIEIEVQGFFKDSTLNLALQADWGSQNDSYRNKIRSYIHREISSDPNFLNLEITPDPTDWAISISHCRDLGGVFWKPQVTGGRSSLGFDLELNLRCKAEAMGRVSTPEEMSEAPSMAALWTAKEAAYKAIPRLEQPASVSQIKIGLWKKLPPKLAENFTRLECWQWEVLSIKGDNQGHTPGIVICQSDHTFAFTLKSFTTGRLK